MMPEIIANRFWHIGYYFEAVLVFQAAADYYVLVYFGIFIAIIFFSTFILGCIEDGIHYYNPRQIIEADHMKYLVSGGAGFIGSHIVEALAQQQHEIVILDNLFSGKVENIQPFLKKRILLL